MSLAVTGDMQRLDATAETSVSAVAFAWQAGGGGNDHSFRGKSRSYIVRKGGLAGAVSTTKVDAVAFQCQGTNVGEMGALRRGNGNVTGGVPFVTHTLSSEGADASEDGTGRGEPLVPSVIAFQSKNNGESSVDLAPTLGALGHKESHANAGGQIAVSINQRREGDLRAAHGSLNGHTSGTQFDGVLETMGVRRLLPVETERLQGYPDDWTLVPYGKKGKLAADGPRYRAIGNAFPTPVIRWIGERIQMVEEIIQAQKG